MDDVRGGKVTVMGVLETRGVRFEAVVIVDFNEGVVPATSSKDQFLNSQVRALLIFLLKMTEKHCKSSTTNAYWNKPAKQPYSTAPQTTNCLKVPL